MSFISDMATREEKAPYVTFHRKPVEDPAASQAAGHYVARDVDFVHITPAYTKDVIIREVGDWFEKLEGDVRNERIPSSWIDHYKKAYAAWKSGQELPLNGMPVRGWNMISPAMQETLCQMQMLTVEDVAGMTEDAMRRVGMGALDIKHKAIATIKASKDIGPVAMENAELRKKLDMAETNLKELESKFNILRDYVASKEAGASATRETTPEIPVTELLPDEEPPKARRGRPAAAVNAG